MFISYWELDAGIYQHPHTLLAKGYGDIRALHVVRLLEPDLKAVLISRTVMGNRVVDTQRVTRNFPYGKGEVDAVGIYEVLGGRIRKAWFLMARPACPERKPDPSAQRILCEVGPQITQIKRD
ncbi:hypothetical protein [Asticcacaulis sp. AC402]|uniref:nuclear transport factor 2 family protein n=1 Tax=Asticcacaulis sp. AC402 TaxID=1282361 RepID=UPI0003C3CD33|nr:hypothetical protein [Asticcacaulis sp. AC402]ESQ77157.1 hypothetical protein ABAC402_01795 [Asticcacaulis sp. AC402]